MADNSHPTDHPREENKAADARIAADPVSSNDLASSNKGFKSSSNNKYDRNRGDTMLRTDDNRHGIMPDLASKASSSSIRRTLSLDSTDNISTRTPSHHTLSSLSEMSAEVATPPAAAENESVGSVTATPVQMVSEADVEPGVENFDNYENYNQRSLRRRGHRLEKTLTETTAHVRNTSKPQGFDFFGTPLDPSDYAPDIPDLDDHPMQPHPLKQAPQNTMQQKEQGNNQQSTGGSVDESPYVQPLLQLFEAPTKMPLKSTLVTGVGPPGIYDEDDPHQKTGSIIQFPNPLPSIGGGSVNNRNVSFGRSADEDSLSLGGGFSASYHTDDEHTTDGDEGAERSSKSLDSSIYRAAAMAIPALSMSAREKVKKSIRAGGRTVHHSDRMVSLTVDMETGRAGVRGQHAMMRGTSFAEAQSPRLRRRKGWSHMMKKARKTFAKRLGGPSNPIDGGGARAGHKGPKTHRRHPSSDEDDDEDNDSAISDQVKQAKTLHGRLVVKQRSVLVDDEPIQNTGTGHLETCVTQHEEVQYRLSAMTTTSLRRRRGRGLGGGEGNSRGLLQKIQSNIYDEVATPDSGGYRCCFVRPNRLVHRYLFWAFRNSFLIVFLSAAALFYFFTSFFALLLYLLGSLRPNCIYVSGETFGQTEDPFMDVYALSWTTFTTVGYGSVFPSTSATTMNARECMGISILTTIEAFVGIVFASFWGAIFFSKITRVSSHAPVTFSDAMIVKYGSGISGAPHGDDDDDKSSEEEPESFMFPSSVNVGINSDTVQSAPGSVFVNKSAKSRGFRYKRSKLPCPFLEFRVVNNLYNQRGGEIIDATMNIVASMDEDQAALAVQNAARGSNRNSGSANQRRRRRMRGKLRPVVGSGGVYSEDLEEVDLTDEGSIKKLQESVKTMVVAHNKAWAVEIDPSGKFLPRRIFCKLDFESQEHPFFKRIWQVRHILDHNSPLLKQEAKEMVRLNGGHWPVELNNAEAVRASIHFDQILVSLSGTSNVDANVVYSQKVYDYVDMCVGYSFCNMLFRDNGGCIQVDPNLLNDVQEQEGGGGEVLETDTQKNLDFVL